VRLYGCRPQSVSSREWQQHRWRRYMRQMLSSINESYVYLLPVLLIGSWLKTISWYTTYGSSWPPQRPIMRRRRTSFVIRLNNWRNSKSSWNASTSTTLLWRRRSTQTPHDICICIFVAYSFLVPRSAPIVCSASFYNTDSWRSRAQKTFTC